MKKPEKRKIEGLNLNKAQNKHFNQACDKWEKYHKEVTAELLKACKQALLRCQTDDLYKYLLEQTIAKAEKL